MCCTVVICMLGMFLARERFGAGVGTGGAAAATVRSFQWICISLSRFHNDTVGRVRSLRDRGFHTTAFPSAR
jgi:hypothetical protein